MAFVFRSEKRTIFNEPNKLNVFFFVNRFVLECILIKNKKSQFPI